MPDEGARVRLVDGRVGTVCKVTPDGSGDRVRLDDGSEVHVRANDVDEVLDEEIGDLPRDRRQELVASWAAKAFGHEEATSLPQRGLRLLEEAIEAFQACGGDETIAHKLVAYVFGRPKGEIWQELGGVAVTTLALAAAAGVSADEEECREIRRVLSKPVGEFSARNASKNAAGFKIATTRARCPWAGCSSPDACDGTPHRGTEEL